MQDLKSAWKETPAAPGLVSLSQRIKYWFPAVSVKPVPLAAGQGGSYADGVNVDVAEDVDASVDVELEIT